MESANALSVKAIGGYHPITVRLITFLETGKPNDEKTDSELKDCAGIDVTPGSMGYGYLQSACKHLSGKTGIKWQRVRGEGKIVCLNDVEKIEHCKKAVTHIRRTSRRSNEVLVSIDIEALPEDKRKTTTALSAQLGAISFLSKSHVTKKLIKCDDKPNIGDAMKLFANK